MERKVLQVTEQATVAVRVQEAGSERKDWMIRDI
jgi:hypothetical protein